MQKTKVKCLFIFCNSCSLFISNSIIHIIDDIRLFKEIHDRPRPSRMRMIKIISMSIFLQRFSINNTKFWIPGWHAAHSGAASNYSINARCMIANREKKSKKRKIQFYKCGQLLHLCKKQHIKNQPFLFNRPFIYDRQNLRELIE